MLLIYMVQKTVLAVLESNEKIGDLSRVSTFGSPIFLLTSRARSGRFANPMHWPIHRVFIDLYRPMRTLCIAL